MAKGIACAAVALLALTLLPAAAQADRAFSPRFSANTQGDITFAANGVLSCVPAESGCLDARNGAGTRLNNNDRVMTYIDVDTDDATFNSSDATLSLPTGARVLFAGLYWGGRSAAGTGGLPAPNAGLRGTVSFQAPGDTAYRTVTTASPIDESGQQEYQAFADVTSIVAGAGPGEYRTANVQVGTGRNASQSHGWALIVVYGDPAAPPRNLTVFDGFTNVASGSPGVTIPLAGFQTPPAGAVNSTVGVVAQEGDLGTLGDGATIQGAGGATVPLGNAVNPPGPPQAARNVFNSSISRNGVYVTDTVPPDTNNFGFDVDTFATSNVLGNSQPSTQVGLTTSGDAYIPGVVFIATDLYAPQIEAIKEVAPTGPADLGDVLTYTAAFENVGDAVATDFVATDAIPAGTTYVPGSLAIDGVAQTDAAGDDRAELAGGQVVARLGTGADATAGGTIAVGPAAASTVTFQVRINDSGFAPGAEITNTARADFTSATTGVDYAPVQSAPVVTRLRVPDVAVIKQHSPAYVAGGTSQVLIAAFNIGEGPTNGEVVVSDTLPAGLSVNGAILADGWTCDVSGQTITCRRSDVFDPQEPIPAILVPVQVAAGTATADLSNTATVTNASDGNTDNNSVTDEGAVSEPQFDLSVEKTVVSEPPAGLSGFPPGGPIEYTVTVRNDGAFPAPNVQLSEIIPAPMDFTSGDASQGTCTAAGCSLGTIAPGQEVTIDLVLTLSSDEARYPSAEDVVNRVEVTADGTDVDPDNNAAEASIQSLPIVALSITKAFTPARPAAGGPITFTMQVRNAGPGIADVEIGDLLPPEIEDPQLSITGGTGECTIGQINGAPPGFPDLPVCIVPGLEVGGTRTFTISGRLAADSADTTITNLAAVAGLAGEVDFSDNAASVSFTPGTVDVGIEKTLLGPNVVPPGDEAVFRLRAFNAGNLPAPDVVVTDTLPAGFTPQATPAGCALVGQLLTCTIGELPEGEERVFEVVGEIEDAAAGAVLENVATIETGGPDLTPGNDSSEALLFVPPQPDLGITKTRVGPVSVPVGGEARFALRITNTGDAPGVDVVARDTLPAGLTPISPPVGCTIQARDVICSIGDLPAGEERSFEIRARAEPSAAGKTLTNRATVDAAEPDPNPGNDEGEAEVSVAAPPEPPPGPSADVAVTVTPPASPYTVGVPGTWRLRVVNNGPAPATNVQLEATRSGVRAQTLNATIAQSGCQAGVTTRCGLGNLAVGESRTVRLRLRPLEGGRLTVTASVDADEADSVPPNDTDAASIRPRRANVVINTEISDRRLDPGGRAGLLTEVDNRGPGPALGFRVCVALPEGLNIVRRGGARLRGGKACWRTQRLADDRARRLLLAVQAANPTGRRRVCATVTVSGSYIRTRRSRVCVVVLPAQSRGGGVTG